MKRSIERTLLTGLAAIILLAACAPAQVVTPNPTDVAMQVATAVALTVASQNLDTAEAAPVATETPLPTETPAVVNTPTAILPTATPFVLVPPTTVPGGSGGRTPVAYQCDIIHQRPFDYTSFKPGDKFDVKWTILNTGTKTMQAGLDLKYNQGPKMISTTRVQLPQLKPGDQYDLQFDATAPTKEGQYIMTYIVEGGLCYPYVAIRVER